MDATVMHDATTPGAGAYPADAAAMQPAELRWAGAALALGGLLFVLGVILGLRAFGGEWDTGTGPTLPRTAALIQENWPGFRLIWSGELAAAMLLAVAAFLLQRRPQERRRWLPAAVAWIGVGTGSLLVAVSYAVTLGSYPAALASFDGQPALFAALRGASLSIHATGSVLQLLGLIGALAIEFRWQARAVPDRLVQAGSGVALLGFAAAVTGLVPGESAAAGVFTAAALLGAAIWLRAGESARGAQVVRAFLWALIVGVTLLGVLAPAAQAQGARPILDMHMHAMSATAQGPSTSWARSRGSARAHGFRPRSMRLSTRSSYTRCGATSCPWRNMARSWGAATIPVPANRTRNRA
jgi:hypothetical protein